MSKNGLKLKLFQDLKSHTTKGSKKIIYPTLKNNLNETTKNLSVNNRILNWRKKLNRTSSAFLERNYDSYLNKLSHEKKIINASMINSSQLNTCLFKLKQYYNELVAYNNHKFNKLQDMNNTIKKDEEKLKKLKELSHIDLPDEKIGIKNDNSLKLSKEQMEKNIFSLINQQKIIEESLKNQEDYNKTLEHMLKSEQNHLFLKKQESINILEKIDNLNKYQKIVNENKEKNDKKEKDFNILKNKIFNEMNLVQQINMNQNINIENLENEINQKEEEITKLKEIIENIKNYENIDMKKSKEELKEKIKNAKEFENKRIINEKKCIEIINTLSLIQKIIYEDQNNTFEKENLILSKEYQILYQINKGNNILILPEKKNYLKEDTKYTDEKNLLSQDDKNRIFSAFSSTYNENKFSDLNNTMKNNRKNITVSATFRKRKRKRNERFKKIGNKTSSTFYQTHNEFSSFIINDNISLNESITKFNTIKITKNEIFDFISGVLSKLDFYRSQLNLLRKKEINLEDKKSQYNTKVKNIISDNYFNFEDITKNNEKCKEFLEKNKYFLNKTKKLNQKIKMDNILKKIGENSESNNNDENDLNDEINNDNVNNNNVKSDSIIFKASNNLITNIKNFFLICSDSLKDILNILNDKNNNNAEEDDNNNPLIDVLKKLNEFETNKDIYISDDYKLLLQYIKNLIKFCKENNNILPKEILDDINTNLIEKFYKKGEINKLDKIFINRFLAKKNPNYNNIFIHFNQLSDQVIENIKLIYDLVHSGKNKLYPKEKDFNIITFNNIVESQSKNSENGNNTKNKAKKRYKQRNSIKSVKSVKNINNSASNYYNNKFAELCEDIEDNINDSSDAKVINIKKKWKIKSLDKKITDKLYNPFLKKTNYLRQLNPNIPNIKQITSRTSKTNYEILKKIREVDNIAYQMNIYNNPNIDVNKLCNNTYNSLVKLIYSNTKRNSNRRTGKYRIIFNNK